MPLKRRGAQNNPESSYAATRCKAVNDGWELVEKTPLRTTVNVESTRRIINRNTAPDIPFGQSINPYRGCKHGCIYYYAGLGLSPGLDFESCLFVKPDAANRVRAELSQPGNIPLPIDLGANIDLYLPIERRWRISSNTTSTPNHQNDKCTSTKQPPAARRWVRVTA
jgi:DNA repair photolyase